MAARLILESEVIEVTRPPLLVYGEPGSGKTSLAQTASKSLTLDFDQGLHRSGFRKAGCRFDTWVDVVQAERDGVFNPYETIVLDTVGTLLEYMGRTIVDGNAKMGTKAGGLSLQGWGVLKTTFGQWLSALRQNGKQVIMIAHQKEEKDGDDKVLRPDIAGGSYSIVMNSADIVGYVSYRNNQRYIAWEPTDRYFAKNGAQLKSGPIPDFAKEPHFMADLLTQAKANLGHTSEASAKAAKIVDEWRTKLSELGTDLDKLNAAVPGISKLDPGVKAQVWTLIQDHATPFTEKWDGKAKKFLPKVATEPTADPEAPSPLDLLYADVAKQFDRLGTTPATRKTMLSKYKADTIQLLNEAACKLLIAELAKIPDREAGDEPEEEAA